MAGKIIRPITNGQQFGRLTAIGYAGRNARGTAQWKWRCVCGTEVIKAPCHVTSGRAHSCGCLHPEAVRTHNRSRTREYRTWCGMKARCTNANAKGFHRYGGRGISICPEWERSFEAFLRDVGPCPKGYSLDRIDNNGNYEPGNCRWATVTQQACNTRVNHRVTFEGRTLCISEWVEITGIKRITLINRLARGWSPREAFTTPVTRRGYKLRRR